VNRKTRRRLLRVAAVLAASTAGCSLEVPSPSFVASIAVAPARDTVVLPLTVQLSAGLLGPTGATVAGYAVTWASSDTSVARVSPAGLVTTVALGVDTITATADGVTGTAVLAVAPLVTVAPRLPSLFAGDTLTLAAAVTDANGAALNAGPLSWTSDAPAVARVDSDGLVSSFQAGRATIVATAATGQTSVVVVVMAPTSHPNREIAFLTEDSLFQPELHTIMPDGSGERRVSNPGQYPEEFDWSPDGNRLAVTYFQPSGAKPAGLYIMNADGSSATAVLAGSVNAPRWSPDGTRIAFSRYVQSGVQDIFTINADGTGLQRLTSGTSLQELPEWSPDGRRIAYLQAAADGSELWVMDADGSHQQRFAMPVEAVHPSWSPDGRQIAFDNGYGIWLVNADGSDPRPLTPNCTPTGSCDPSVSYFAPEWSFDGQKLTYGAGDQVGDRFVVVSTTAGTVLAQGGTDQCCAVFTFPQWSPDGTKVAYLGTQPASPDWPGVAVANADLTGSLFITGAQNAVPVGGQSPAGGRRWRP
jgi:Tol biopolymer transport system component